jgi:hypothetical protein
MTKVTRFTDAEVAESADFEAVSLAAREGDEAIVGGAIGYPNHWADFTVSTPSSVTVRVNEGRYFADNVFYDLDTPANIDMQVHLPIVVGDERYVAILARGVSEIVDQQRFVETDVDTGETVLTPVPKIDRRSVEFVVQQGLSSPTPIKPVVADNNCCVCFIRLASTGIVSIESNNDDRVKTLFEVEGRVTVLEAQMVIAFQRTTTLSTDLANLQARLKDIPRPETIRQLQRDASRTRRLLNLPDEARGYFYDPGLVKDQWALDNALWLARVAEGIRFAFAAERDERLEVLNPGQAGIRIEQDVLMPAWTEKVRVEVDGAGATKNISQQVHTVTTAVARQVARSSVNYGPTVAMCDNVAEWAQIGTAREGQTFQASGETFEKIGVIDASFAGAAIDTSIFSAIHGSAYGANDVIVHNSQVTESGNRQIYAARSVEVSSWTETYWDYVTENFGINGSVYAQTFLLTQPMVLTSVELKFDRVDTDGAVTLFLCEVSNVGTPMFERVIAQSTLQPSAIAKGWARFPFVPRYLAPGKRYAWVSVTTGNYSLHTVTGSAFTQGTLFYSTDGAWFGGSQEEDFCFRLNAADFTVNRATVEFDPLTLENGMTEIKLIYESWAPEGTSMMWEVKPSGSDNWSQLAAETAENPNPLRGLPALCQLRLTLIGTNGIAPAIILNTKARGLTRRPRGDARAISKVLNFGYSTTSILVEVTLDQFDELYHTAVPKIVIGSTTYTAGTVSMARDLSKVTRRLLTATFTVPSTPSARLQIDMATTTTQAVPFVENVSLFAL